MTKLVVDNLFLSYDATPILKGVSFTLNAGEVVSLLGASGSGKTTLLRAIAGLEQPSAGSIRLNEQTLYDGDAGHNLPVENRSLGLVFQSYALWPHRTVAENVGYGLKLRKTGQKEIADRVGQVLEQLGLGALGQRYPHQLSGGQQQRVAIARALVYNPPVILLDEPLSNLDAKLREEARAWLRELIIELKLSALCVTHDQGEAMAMSDRILLLKHGRIEQAGTPTELYSQPASLYSAQFMGANNTLSATVAASEGDSVILNGDGWQLRATARQPLPAGSQAQAVIRLERLRVRDEPGHNRLPARLLTSMYLGDRWEYLLQQGENRLRAYGQEARAAGECWLEFGERDTWAFGREASNPS
ncbi:ABC transporter ATP-binding protein [Chromobacterium vaccinii]|uniref:ABC transporter ATP-binding protein n=1 Tax=Chromobacterium vaccinii TaxID=1108595 RepID=UPI001E4F9EB2|nr:ABC transporter ATP-binding protein [Chromobacterium vaccinii]MCD4483273.1 ABC transporter ATP-binding protein [Chromobacterium vaccinii]MCD4499367.1 ABC transporter ATP-binding protein [Chromobacterium vaccinii]